MDANALWEEAERLGIGEHGFHEAIEALGRTGRLRVKTEITDTLRTSITLSGLTAYARATRPDFHAIRRAVIAALLNAEGPPPPLEVSDIVEAIEVPAWLAELVLEELKARNLIGMSRGLGNLARINRVSPVLRRHLDD